MDRNLVFSFELFGKELSVYWYGVMIAIGILCCFSIMLIYAKYAKFEEKFTDFCFYTVIASIACGFGSAALFQAFYNFLDNPQAGFKFSGGLTFIGGLIGGVGFYLVIYAIFRTKFNDRLPKLLPILGPCVLLLTVLVESVVLLPVVVTVNRRALTTVVILTQKLRYILLNFTKQFSF